MIKEINRENRIANLRDLGGYIGRDGLTVKKNLIYRSGNLNFTTEVLAEELSPLSISMVFDLRSSAEVGINPYALPENISYRHRPILPSLEDDIKASTLAFPGNEDMINNSRSRSFLLQKLFSSGDFMSNIYGKMGESPETFGDIIKEIIENGGSPVLFHCSAGKDRTGILAAMILLALGVSLKDTKENYLLSNEYRKEEIEKEMHKISAGIDDPEFVSKIRDMLMVKEEYIEATLKIVNSYPTFEDYAQNKLGLTSGDLEALRQLYLEQKCLA